MLKSKNAEKNIRVNKFQNVKTNGIYQNGRNNKKKMSMGEPITENKN